MTYGLRLDSVVSLETASSTCDVLSWGLFRIITTNTTVSLTALLANIPLCVQLGAIGTYGHPALTHLLNTRIFMWWQLTNMVQPRVPQRIHLRCVEFVIGSVVDPTMSQVELVMVLVVLIAIPIVPYHRMRCQQSSETRSMRMGWSSLPVNTDKTTGFGVTDVVQIPPELFDSFLSDIVDCSCERHLVLISTSSRCM